MDDPIRIGIIGDYDPNRLSHKATDEALRHCAEHLDMDIEVRWLPTGSLETNAESSISGFDGLWCAPGEYGSKHGALNAIRFAREDDRPFIGTCAGFQFTVIEYARNKLGLADVQHAEYDANAANLIIVPLSCSLVGETRKVFINENSRVQGYYRETEVEERFSCRFGIDPHYRELIDESGFRVVGTDENGEARILELDQKRFYVATLFQPQLSSTRVNPHRLISAYLVCSKEYHDFQK